MNLDRQLKEDGYFIVRDVLDSAHCAHLLREIVAAIPSTRNHYIHEKDYRVHCPLSMTAPVRRAVGLCARAGSGPMGRFLSRRQLMVELSSIVVFPGAAGQPPHQDENDAGKRIMTVFMNLVPTRRGVGALRVVPGSHAGKTSRPRPARVLELPAGSAVFMNGKLIHGGTENSSIDRIRPVFYCSFGDDDIQGPTYSIRPDYRHRYQLSDFLGRPPDGSSRPRFGDGHWTSLDLTRPMPRTSLLLMAESSVWQVAELDEGQEWLVELMTLLNRSPGKLTVAQLAKRLEKSRQDLIDALSTFGEIGFLEW